MKIYEEVNLIDWPLAVLDKDVDITNRDGRVYQISVWNKINKKLLNGFLKIYFIAGEETNSLFDYDEDVLLGLMSLAYDNNFVSQTMRFSSKNEILERINWSRGGKNYTKLEGSLTRLAGVLLETNIFYNKALNIYEKRKFHIIDRVSSDRMFFGYQKKAAKKGSNTIEIEWSSTMWMSMNAGYLKPTNYNMYLKLKTAGARKLYRILDKRFYKKASFAISVYYLGANMLGIHESKSQNTMRKIVNRYAKELVDVGFLAIYGFTIRQEDGKLMFIARRSLTHHSRDSKSSHSELLADLLNQQLDPEE